MPDDETTTEGQAPEAGTGSARGRSHLMPLLIALGCAIGGSVLGAVALPTLLARFERPQAPAPRPETRGAQETRGIPLEPFKVMVNLADERARRMLNAGIVLEARDSAAEEALKERTIEITHLLISLLSEKRLVDVEGKEAKDKLMREIRLSINERLGMPDGVIHVYFSQFMIQ